ncbi:hypothetical protein BI49514_00512 [Brevibacterium iodinum ATCC 49514]|uniref:Uncharacterized protein n=1 Tax=Brevibacterium iodinum ATCC 49514 TaxID=1255616 RepID=A0A2H1HY90_9MICO|nr:hypothetical protein [Brevibacterium iodinum]SMX67903.1 hypothetical protein BI49514_00512 [Brevibacterium iodinum ATCC 49514]SUW13795.1 Uncharacterised protein [Brevibacterium iodinum]
MSYGDELKGLPTLSVGLFSIGDSSLLKATRVLVGVSSARRWAIATWLIPALVAGGIWRHAFWIGPAVWEMVFVTMVTSFVRALRSR